MQKKVKNIFPNIQKEKNKFIDSLSSLTNRDKYTKSILFLYHNLNEKQNYINFDYNKLHIEHILPKAYQNYDNWNKEEYDSHLNSLGNLTLLEKKNNIKAKNEFFDKKKEIYKNSEIIDVQKELCKLKKWTPKECSKRFNDIKDRLIYFLFN
ncbi:HNH endonuclease family protein [uncultured Brachyspira sp.]|nr:HNH endonuclease family protein [uncultured Brachyspira sp.]